MLKVFCVAGEASADLIGARLITEIRKKLDIACFGVGGKQMRAAGVDTIVDASKLNVVGISDWFDKIPQVLKAYQKIKKSIAGERPALAILMDLPDFNLRLARRLRKLGVPVIYYVSPQVWAWRRYRIRTIQENVNKMLVLFPFEKKFYQKYNVDVECVGHPLVDVIQPRSQYRSQITIQESPRIAILPGSRKSEIRFHSRKVNELAVLLQKRYPKAILKIPIAGTLSKVDLQPFFHTAVELCENTSALEILRDSDVALVASGTATLESALVGTPLCVFYQVSRSSAWIFNQIVRYKGPIALPNILAGEKVCKEFFQETATVKNLFDEIQTLLGNEDYRNLQIKQFAKCREMLGQGGASHRAASEILKFLQEKAI